MEGILFEEMDDFDESCNVFYADIYYTVNHIFNNGGVSVSF